MRPRRGTSQALHLPTHRWASFRILSKREMAWEDHNSDRPSGREDNSQWPGTIE